MRELRLTPIQMGYVFSAFGLTYAAFEIPSGWLIDRIGPRKVLTRVVLWWSFFTMATGWAWSFPSLLSIRLLFGAGESGCYPGLAKVFARWLPPPEKRSTQPSAVIDSCGGQARAAASSRARRASSSTLSPSGAARSGGATASPRPSTGIRW